MAEKISESEAAALKEPSAPETVGGLPPEAAKPDEGLVVLISPKAEAMQTSRGEFFFRPMVMGQTAEFIAVAQKLLPMMQETLMGKSEVSLTRLLSADRTAFFRAVAIGCTPLPEDDDEDDTAFHSAIKENAKNLRRLTPDEFLKVATKFVVVNLDFFVRNLPSVLGLAEASVFHALKKFVEDGPSRSNGLLKQVTAGRKSADTH